MCVAYTKYGYFLEIYCQMSQHKPIKNETDKYMYIDDINGQKSVSTVNAKWYWDKLNKIQIDEGENRDC